MQLQNSPLLLNLRPSTPLDIRLPGPKANPGRLAPTITDFYGAWSQEFPTSVPGASFNFITALGDPSGFSSIDPTGGRGGSPAVKIQETAAASSWGGFNIATGQRQFVSFMWIKANQSPTLANAIITQCSGPANPGSIRFGTTGTFSATVGTGGNVATYSGTVTLGNWYYVCALFDYTSSVFRIDWSVYDESAGLWTSETPAISGGGDVPADIVSVRFGQVASAGQWGDATHVGAWWQTAGYSLVRQDYPIMPVESILLAPNSVGTHNLGAGSFQKTGAVAITGGDTTSYQEIDEQPPVGTDFVAQTAIDATAYLEYGFTDFTSINANQPIAVKVYAEYVGSAASGAYTAEVRLTDGTETLDVLTGGTKSGVTTSDRAVCYNRIPSGGVGVWDGIAVDQLRVRFGYSNDVTPNPQLNGAFLEVLVPIGGAVSTSAYTDADTVLITITPSSSDVLAAIDAATVPITIVASGIDTFTSTALLTDTATRTVSNGLGTPDIGPAYSRKNGIAGVWAVGSGVISITPEGSGVNDIQTSAIATANIDLGFDFKFPALASGAAYNRLSIGGRYTGLSLEGVRLDLVWDGTNISYDVWRDNGATAGLLGLGTTLAYTAGTQMSGRLVMDGTSVRLAIWVTANGQSGWQIDAVESSVPTAAGDFVIEADNNGSGVGNVITVDNINVTSNLVSFTDQGSPTIIITPSSVNTAQFVDTGKPLITVIPSAAEAYGAVDVGTVPLSIIPSGTDIAQFADAVTALINIIPSSTDIAQYVDTNKPLINILPSSADILAAIDAVTVPLSIIPSSADILTAVDSGTPLITFTPSGVDLHTIFDAATALVNVIPSSADILAAIEVGTPLINIIPITTFEGSGGLNTDAAIVPLQITPSAFEIGDDGGVVPIFLTPRTMFEAYTGVGFSTGTPLISVVPSTKADVMVYTEAGTPVILVTPSGTEAVGLSSSGVGVILITPSSVDTAAFVDIATALINIIPSGIDVSIILNFCLTAVMKLHYSVTMEKDHYQITRTYKHFSASMYERWSVNFRGRC